MSRTLNLSVPPAMVFIGLVAACGDGEVNLPENDPFTDKVNWDKLEETPFEFYTPENPPHYALFYDDTLTDEICSANPTPEACDEFGEGAKNPYATRFLDAAAGPLQLFAAYFTDREEAEIMTGIDLANAAAGFELYELADEWSDDVLVVYKVSDIEQAAGITSSSSNTTVAGGTLAPYYRLFGLCYSGVEVVDGVVLLSPAGAKALVVAHELGHLAGLAGHVWVQFGESREEEFLDCLEDHALMGAIYEEWHPVSLESYDEMMPHQGEILRLPFETRRRDAVQDCPGLWEEPEDCR